MDLIEERSWQVSQSLLFFYPRISAACFLALFASQIFSREQEESFPV